MNVDYGQESLRCVILLLIHDKTLGFTVPIYCRQKVTFQCDKEYFAYQTVIKKYVVYMSTSKQEDSSIWFDLALLMALACLTCVRCHAIAGRTKCVLKQRVCSSELSSALHIKHY